MPDQGDLHNFGQAVHSVERASGIYFQKPRPVYWEWLFFGRTSPLALFFTEKGEGGFSPGANLFGLDVEMAKNFSGYSRRVEAAIGSPSGNAHAYSLGVLLAYCYVFGVRDLHRHNIIPTSSYLQVVDAEVVLVKLLLPHETLLLPFKDISPELAAISHLGFGPEGPSMDAITSILSGYVDTFNCIIKNLAAIQAVFRDRRDEMKSIPIRHIARDTVHYRNWRTTLPEVPFFYDELEQLERGDIPYFFKFIGDPALYKYTDAFGGFAEVTVPGEFAKAVARDAANPEELLKPERVEDVLLPTGLLFFAKRLLAEDFVGHVQSGDVVLSKEPTLFKLRVRGREYQTDRSTK